jgi:hypothetical protein
MSTKHTPLPWFYQSDVIYSKTPSDGYETTAVAYVGDELRHVGGLQYGKPRDANAALIVRAVNSHDAMVKALETAVDRLEMVAERRMPNSNAFIPAVDAALEQCRAALSALNTSGADQPGTAAIVPNQQDDGSKG